MGGGEKKSTTTYQLIFAHKYIGIMIIFNIVLPFHRSSLAAAPLSNAVDTNVVHAISKAHKKNNCCLEEKGRL